MLQNKKDLLLKDLCARLPYEVKVQSYSYEDDIETVETLYNIDSDGYMSTLECDTLKNIAKPYLFPLSSISEDLKNELYTNLTELELKALNGEIEHSAVSAFEIDFYHKHHIDYRGLIPMGLAIDATGKNIY